MDEIKTGAIVSATVAIAGGLYRFIQWLVTAALSSAEKSNDRLEGEVDRAHTTAREAKEETIKIQARLSDVEKENATLKYENYILNERVKALEELYGTH